MTKKPEPKYYYPWSTGKPPYPKSHGNILTNLQRLGFPVFHYQEKDNMPEDRTMKAVKFICDTLYGFREDEEVLKGDKAPWLFLVSNAPTLLQALADLVPMVFATSFGSSVMKVDNTTLTSAILAKKPRSIWDDDPSGEFLSEAKKTSILFWNFVNRSVNQSRFCEGEIGNILDLRSSKLTVFTSTYYGRYYDTKSKKPTGAAIIGNIEKVFGESVSGALDANAQMVHLAVNRKINNEVIQRKI